MKKTRILASLLCIMMIVCALPVMQASAAVGDTDASVDAILGFRAAAKDNLSYNFEGGITAPAGSTNGCYTNASVTGGVDTNADGLIFVPGENTTIWYATPIATNPYVPGTATVMRARFTSEKGAMNLQFNHPDNVNKSSSADKLRAYFDITPTIISGHTKNISFNFGTDWFDLMYVPLDEGLSVYLRNDSTNGWQLIMENVEYKAGGTSGHMSMSSSKDKNDVVIKSLTTYAKKTRFIDAADALNVDCAGKVYDIQIDKSTESNPEVGYHANYPNGSYTANGLAFGTTTTIWGVQPITDLWAERNATIIKAKLGTASDQIQIQASGIADKTRSYYTVAKDQVHHGGSSNLTTIGYLDGDNSSPYNRFAPGTDWFELMIVNEETQQVFYGKNAQTNYEWSYLGTVPGYETGKNPNKGYCCVSGVSVNTDTPTLVKSISLYKENLGGESIEEVLGASVVASPNAWDFRNSNMTNHERTGAGKTTFPAGAKITSEGLDLSAATGAWSTYAHSAWSPLTSGDRSTLIPRAVYAKVKGTVTITLGSPNTNNLVVLNSVPNTTLVSSGGTIYDTIVPDNNWIEYLFVPTALNGSSTVVYAKTTVTDEWVRVLTTSATALANPDNIYGIQFSGTGVVEGFKTVEYNASVVTAEANTKPENANYLYFGEEFESEPTYANKKLQTVTVANGVANMPVKYANEELGISPTGHSKMWIYGLSIPVGGYAEFKSKSSALQKFTFFDGTKKIRVNAGKDYNVIDQGTTAVNQAGYIADSDTVWRTFRIVRSANGYSVYSKVDGVSGWRIHSLEGSVADASAPQFYCEFDGHTDMVSDGDGMIDYIRVYGVAPNEMLTLTDGYTTTSIDNGATLSYPASLRAIVTENAGKLLVVSYKGDDMAKVQIVNVADMVNNSAILDARATDATKVKVFLWDNFSGLNRKTPAMTFGL